MFSHAGRGKQRQPQQRCQERDMREPVPGQHPVMGKEKGKHKKPEEELDQERDIPEEFDIYRTDNPKSSGGRHPDGPNDDTNSQRNDPCHQ